MSKQSPYNISISEGGRFVRYEWEANYLTDEQLETVRKHVETLQADNAKLRELVEDMADAIVDWYDLIDGAFACESVYEDEKFAPLFDRMRELGVEV